MRGAFKLGEKPILSAAINLLGEPGTSITSNMTYGRLSLTNYRLIFECDVLSAKSENRDIPLGDIERLEAGWTKILKYLLVIPTLYVTTKDGTNHRFCGVMFAVKIRGLVDAINAARATVPPLGPPKLAVDEEAATSYYFQNGGTKNGPLTKQEFDYNCTLGQIGPATLAWAGSGDWRPASSFTTFTAAQDAITSASPPPLPPDNRMVWAIAAVPVVGSIVGLFINSHWLLIQLYLGANTALCIYDAMLLKAGGHDAPDKWWPFVIPAYLWKRAKLLGQSPIFMWIWMAAFVGSLFLDNAGSKAALEADACPLVTQIIQEQLFSSASCKGVSIVKEISKGFYTATATLDNGNDIRLTIEKRDNNVYVKVPRQ